jgi:hypothetical protein
MSNKIIESSFLTNVKEARELSFQPYPAQPPEIPPEATGSPEKPEAQKVRQIVTQHKPHA